MKEHSKSSHPELKVFYNLLHSYHSDERSNERHIKDDDINAALNYCESIFKQGLIYHIVKNKLIPDDISPKLISRIKNLVVVISGKDGRIVTLYRSKNALKRIKQKPDRISKKNIDYLVA